MSVYKDMIVKIIGMQEGIVGPLALEQAGKVRGLKVDWGKKEIEIDGDEREVVNKLVEQYEYFFGRASVEACKEAVRHLAKDMKTDEMPHSLR